MSSRKKQKRQQKAQERHKLKQAVALAGRSDVPAGEAAQRADEASRPTSERKARGTWAEPQGMGKHERPVVDLASDEIGRLYQLGRITSGQEQAARHFESLREAYHDELPDVRGYKSCLAGSVPGFDDSDGNPEIIAAYRKMEKRMTMPQRRELLLVLENERPRNIETLRAALDAIGA
jgi:hypothetical protein